MVFVVYEYRAGDGEPIGTPLAHYFAPPSSTASAAILRVALDTPHPPEIAGAFGNRRRRRDGQARGTAAGLLRQRCAQIREVLVRAPALGALR